MRRVKVFSECRCGDATEDHVMSIERLVGTMSSDLIDAETLQWIQHETLGKRVVKVEVELVDGAETDRELISALSRGDCISYPHAP